MRHSSVYIRPARSDEGPMIGTCLSEWGGPSAPWLDWEHVTHSWLVAEYHGRIAGMVMALAGSPFGQVDFLTVDITLPQTVRSRIVSRLGYGGIAWCRRFGSQAVLSRVDLDDTKWAAMLAKRGWQTVGHGHYLVKRCA